MTEVAALEKDVAALEVTVDDEGKDTATDGEEVRGNFCAPAEIQGRRECLFLTPLSPSPLPPRPSLPQLPLLIPLLLLGLALPLP
jgi:hypothetical protein